MFSDIVLIHRPGSTGFKFDPAVAHQWMLFNTCLRKIAIGDIHHLSSVYSELTPDDELYRGDEAFRFLLQVICGLHSPLIGETEVYGQFKNAVTTFEVPKTPWGVQVNRLFQCLFEDAKKVRNAHLEDLGSQSYGSVLRREMKGLKRVHVLGAGHLVQEILPWLCKDETEIHVHCRDTQKVSVQLAAFSQIRVHDLNERSGLADAEALVVAAPVTASWTAEWLGSNGSLKVIADLRDDSATDKLQATASVLKAASILNLTELLARVTDNQVQLEVRKEAALNAINQAVRERARHVEYRPFGWEDLCA